MIAFAATGAAIARRLASRQGVEVDYRMADIHPRPRHERTDDAKLAEGAAHAGRSARVDLLAHRR
jgi:hypothetical protein